MLAQCKEIQREDSRMEIQEFTDVDDDGYSFRARYVRYLLPIQLDIQSIRWHEGNEPKQRWTYS